MQTSAAAMRVRNTCQVSSVGTRRIAGFTLIELMIVVAVVAILAAIAYPSYNDSVRKGRRGQAKADMMELAQRLERYRTVSNRYDGYSHTEITQSPTTGTARYRIELPVQAQSTFTIHAVPLGGQTSDPCGTLTLNQAGQKTPTTAGCWQ